MSDQITGFQLYQSVGEKIKAIMAQYKELQKQVDDSNLDEITKRKVLFTLWGEEQEAIKPYQDAIRIMAKELGL